MIVDRDGVRWGTAAEIAAHLGHGVTEHTVKNWARPARGDGLPRAQMVGENGRPQTRYPLHVAQQIDKRKRHARRGRKRRLTSRAAPIIIDTSGAL